MTSRRRDATSRQKPVARHLSGKKGLHPAHVKSSKPGSEKTTNQGKTGPKTEAATSPKNRWCHRCLKTWTCWPHRVWCGCTATGTRADAAGVQRGAAGAGVAPSKGEADTGHEPAAATTLGWLLPCPVQWNLGCGLPQAPGPPHPGHDTHVVSRADYRNKNAFTRGPVHGCSFLNTQTCWCREG